MPLPTGDIIGLLRDNLVIRKTVFPISKKNATGWASGLDIPVGGETVIYTGSMYQLLPYIIASVKSLELFEDTFFENFVFLARFFNRFINVSSFIAIPSGKDVREYSTIVRNIARLLINAGVKFGYFYEKELYSGTLAHDLGAEDTFREHARNVYAMLKKEGVKSIITVDPHTTNLMRSVYPVFIDDFDLEVKSYLEVLAEKDIEPEKQIGEDLIIHDSCMYARGERIIDEPRTLLSKAGYNLIELKDSREMTHCCGGPIESLFPSAANRIGAKRVEHLADGNASAVTMCPICLATLKKASEGKLRVEDISTLLARAYCGE